MRIVNIPARPAAAVKPTRYPGACAYQSISDVTAVMTALTEVQRRAREIDTRFRVDELVRSSDRRAGAASSKEPRFVSGGGTAG
jgi:hypothetical protein